MPRPLIALTILIFITAACSVSTGDLPPATATPAPALPSREPLKPSPQGTPPPQPTEAPPAPTRQATLVPPTLTPSEPASARGWEALLAQAKAASAERYQFAVEQGAQIVPAADGKSFYVLWLPKGFATASRRVIIVTLHGHASWAFDELFLWHPFAAPRGYAILALQWWFGEGERFQDYYSPYEMYPIIERVLREQKIARGDAILHGFSRGSANSYAVTALDSSTNKYFGLTIANAGGVGLDFPSNVEIERGKFGARPFAGTQWLLFCGGRDPNPDRDGCPGMTKARAWIEKYGGTVALFLQDPEGDHGAFHRNPANVNTALDLFARLQTTR
jgi:hypothetical protein